MIRADSQTARERIRPQNILNSADDPSAEDLRLSKGSQQQSQASVKLKLE